MKSLFKISVIALLVMSGGLVFGQVPADVGVTATVSSPISIGTITPAAIDVVNAGEAGTLDPQGSAHSASLTGTPTAGHFQITGGFNGASVLIAYGTPATLSDGGANTFTFTGALSHMATTGASQASSADIATSNAITMAEATHEIWVGGSFSAVPNPGSYDTGSAGGTPLAVTLTLQ
ncbi:MAG: hypothetical protein HQ509_12115 [Candidatus Marinimicrobia bacterium]|nr:hypothetical protein [Candidatus Neomarinimicrobiota bacterium]